MMRGQRILIAGLVAGLALGGPARLQAQGIADPDCFPFAPGCERLPRLLDDLAERMAPLLDEFSERIDPFLSELRTLLGDLSGWEAPEVLPNGDILIRRRPAPALPEPPEDQPPVTEPLEL
jgi:hypothetical protein